MACQRPRRFTATWCQARLQGTGSKKEALPCHHRGSQHQTEHCLQGRPTLHPLPWQDHHLGCRTYIRIGRCHVPTWTLLRPWLQRHRRQLLPRHKAAHQCSRPHLQDGLHIPQSRVRRAISPRPSLHRSRVTGPNHHQQRQRARQSSPQGRPTKSPVSSSPPTQQLSESTTHTKHPMNTLGGGFRPPFRPNRHQQRPPRFHHRTHLNCLHKRPRRRAPPHQLPQHRPDHQHRSQHHPPPPSRPTSQGDSPPFATTGPPIGSAPRRSPSAARAAPSPKRQRIRTPSQHATGSDRPQPRHQATFGDFEDDDVDRAFTYHGQPAPPILRREVRYEEALAGGFCKRYQGLTCTGVWPNGAPCTARHACAHCLQDGHPLANCPLIEDFRARMLRSRSYPPYHLYREQQERSQGASAAAATSSPTSPAHDGAAAASALPGEDSAPGAAGAAAATPPPAAPAFPPTVTSATGTGDDEAAWPRTNTTFG